MKYFAYGSNMSLKRLKERIPSAMPLGLYKLKGHQLKFHKVGKDGSGKGDAFYTNNPQDTIYGALFEFDPADKPTLDKIEGVGKGYNIKEVTVTNAKGERVSAYTYTATNIKADLLPFSWYLNHVIVGAKEVGVPSEYLSDIINTASVEDLDKSRNERNFALYNGLR